MIKTIADPNYLRLTSWLKEKREEKKVSIRDLAKQLGCGSSLITKYERNHVRVDVLRYYQICTILEVDPAEGLKTLGNNPC